MAALRFYLLTSILVQTFISIEHVLLLPASRCCNGWENIRSLLSWALGQSKGLGSWAASLSLKPGAATSSKLWNKLVSYFLNRAVYIAHVYYFQPYCNLVLAIHSISQCDFNPQNIQSAQHTHPTVHAAH